jgi:hypothetical protein
LNEADVLCGERRLLQIAALCPEGAPIGALAFALDAQADEINLRLRLDELANWGLIGLGGETCDVLDMHPLVREHFAKTIQDSKPLHARLCEFFASVPISPKARSLSRVSARIWSVEHAAAAGDFARAERLLFDQPLCEHPRNDPASTVGNLTLSNWFQHYGQSAFELAWLRRFVDPAAPHEYRRGILNAMALAAGALGDVRERGRILAEASLLRDYDRG